MVLKYLKKFRKFLQVKYFIVHLYRHPIIKVVTALLGEVGAPWATQKTHKRPSRCLIVYMRCAKVDLLYALVHCLRGCVPAIFLTRQRYRCYTRHRVQTRAWLSELTHRNDAVWTTWVLAGKQGSLVLLSLSSSFSAENKTLLWTWLGNSDSTAICIQVP